MIAQRELLKQIHDTVVMFWRDNSPKGRDVARKRERTGRLLDLLARDSCEQFDGTVLIDGSFNNPNFWLRFSLLRAALGLSRGREIGLIGPYQRRHVRHIFSHLGIQHLVDVVAPSRNAAAVSGVSKALLARTRSADDLLNWSLPDGVHPAIIYDAILKRQRLASVDINRPDIRRLTNEGIMRILRAREILDDTKPSLVVISHTIGMVCGPLAYLAAVRGIPVILVFGLFGALRFARFTTPADLFSFYDRPTRAEIDALPAARAKAMSEIGRTYLSKRFDGRADDLASVYAYRQSGGSIDRAQLCARFGWNPEKPIVAFYASNWFDWPHQFGMTQFRDFLDWTESTFAIARGSSQFNWLFKPHPAEDWFGGVKLADIMARIGSAPHIAVSEKSWNNTQVMNSIDALVTYHGTAGIEFAALGKPVLVPDHGKYDDCGFVRVASSRAEYLSLLARPWWRDIDLGDSRRRAEIFAGWWFCAPAWQKGFVLADDSRQDALYDTIPELLSNNRAEVVHEIETLRGWWASGHRYYHTWKMAQSSSFQLSNV
jgi:hypothetical protein